MWVAISLHPVGCQQLPKLITANRTSRKAVVTSPSTTHLTPLDVTNEPVTINSPADDAADDAAAGRKTERPEGGKNDTALPYSLNSNQLFHLVRDHYTDARHYDN